MISFSVASFVLIAVVVFIIGIAAGSMAVIFKK